MPRPGCAHFPENLLDIKLVSKQYCYVALFHTRKWWDSLSSWSGFPLTGSFLCALEAKEGKIIDGFHMTGNSNSGHVSAQLWFNDEWDIYYKHIFLQWGFNCLPNVLTFFLNLLICKKLRAWRRAKWKRVHWALWTRGGSCEPIASFSRNVHSSETSHQPPSRQP